MSPSSTMMNQVKEIESFSKEKVPENNIKIDLRTMSKEQIKVINSYKKELAKEALCMEDEKYVKVDTNFLNAINNEDYIELDLNKLNGKQRFLVTSCLKELEKLSNPKVYEAKIKVEKRKKNNECAAKFRKKRKQFEIKYEVVRKHIDELVKDVVDNDANSLDIYRKGLSEMKANNILYCLEKLAKSKRRLLVPEKPIKPTPIPATQMDLSYTNNENISKNIINKTNSNNDNDVYIIEQQPLKQQNNIVPSQKPIELNNFNHLYQHQLCQIPIFVTLPTQNSYPSYQPLLAFYDMAPYIMSKN